MSISDSIPSSFLYIHQSEESNGHSTLHHHEQQQQNIICQSEQIIQQEELNNSASAGAAGTGAVQMIPVQELSSNGQEYVLLTPMTVSSKESENCQEVTTESRYIPANRILAESVRGLFFSNDSQSSYKSAEDEISNEDYFDVNQDESSSDYGPSSKRQRRSTLSDDGKRVDPFSDECRIPLPGSANGPYFDSKTFVRRRNERERARVRSVNEGFERLRAHLPFEVESKHRRLSKVETLQCAIQYIQHLKSILDEN